MRLICGGFSERELDFIVSLIEALNEASHRSKPPIRIIAKTCRSLKGGAYNYDVWEIEIEAPGFVPCVHSSLLSMN